MHRCTSSLNSQLSTLSLSPFSLAVYLARTVALLASAVRVEEGW